MYVNYFSEITNHQEYFEENFGKFSKFWADVKKYNYTNFWRILEKYCAKIIKMLRKLSEYVEQTLENMYWNILGEKYIINKIMRKYCKIP